MESYVVEAAEDRGDVEVDWLPFELRPAPKPLLEVRGDHLRTDWTQTVYRRALERGIEIHLPRYQPRSTLPLAACLWAQEQGGCERSSTRSTRRSSARARTSRRTPRSRARRSGPGWTPREAVAGAYSPELGSRLQEIRRQAEAAGVGASPRCSPRTAAPTGAWAASSACSAASRSFRARARQSARAPDGARASRWPAGRRGPPGGPSPRRGAGRRARGRPAGRPRDRTAR